VLSEQTIKSLNSFSTSNPTTKLGQVTLARNQHCFLIVKLHLRHKRTKTFVCLSVVSVRGDCVHPMGGRSAMLHRNLRG